MTRWVNTRKVGLRARTAEDDGPLDRIVKYVPTEIVAAYTLLYTALLSIGESDEIKLYVGLGFIALFFIVTIIYILRFNKDPVSRTAHLVVSPLAFLAWVYPISSDILGDDLFKGFIALILQGVVIALSIVFLPKE